MIFRYFSCSLYNRKSLLILPKTPVPQSHFYQDIVGSNAQLSVTWKVDQQLLVSDMTWGLLVPSNTFLYFLLQSRRTFGSHTENGLWDFCQTATFDAK